MRKKVIEMTVFLSFFKQYLLDLWRRKIPNFRFNNFIRKITTTTHTCIYNTYNNILCNPNLIKASMAKAIYKFFILKSIILIIHTIRQYQIYVSKNHWYSSTSSKHYQITRCQFLHSWKIKRYINLTFLNLRLLNVP